MSIEFTHIVVERERDVLVAGALGHLTASEQQTYLLSLDVPRFTTISFTPMVIKDDIRKPVCVLHSWILTEDGWSL